VDVQVFDFARVARMTVRECGTDFETIMSAQEAGLPGRGITVLQVWLDLSWPFIDAAVEVLRRKGYFFGGLLPRWFGSDGLLMQKIFQRPNWEGIHLYSDRARTLYNFAYADWLRTVASTSENA
jgi:hypothetical protein